MRAWVLACLLVGCGDDGGKSIDAAPPGDAPRIDAPIDAAVQAAALVQVDPCPGTVDATVITTGASVYMPVSTTITTNQIVKFTMNAAHDVAPLPGTDPDLVVPLGGERCFQFTSTGVARFKCTPHGFTGLITVN